MYGKLNLTFFSLKAFFFFKYTYTIFLKIYVPLLHTILKTPIKISCHTCYGFRIEINLLPQEAAAFDNSAPAQSCMYFLCIWINSNRAIRPPEP